MNSTTRRAAAVRWLWALAAVGSAAAVVVGTWLRWNLARPLPSDASLRARFEAHRSEFEALAATAVADTQLVGASHDWMLMRFTVFVHGSSGFNRMLSDGEVRATGRSDYRRLLDRAETRSLSRSRDGETVWFVDLSTISARKGIVYSEEPLAPLRTSLDGLERASYLAPTYVALAPRWFLFVHSSD